MIFLSIIMLEIPLTPPPSRAKRLYDSVVPDFGTGTFEASPLVGILGFNGSCSCLYSQGRRTTLSLLFVLLRLGRWWRRRTAVIAGVERICERGNIIQGMTGALVLLTCKKRLRRGHVEAIIQKWWVLFLMLKMQTGDEDRAPK